ncbi:MAG: hypothetical protein NZ742_02580 [Acidobacteria bacterium]|nr:hypothetical protein [Acidobacteriota bacterium]MDW7983169.1 hypothetical protein [Acidobacteriota bacterium]
MTLADLRPRRKRGRPPKFGRPARAVTVTLPLDVIDKLRAIHTDLSRAIVDLVEHQWHEEDPRQVCTREVLPGQYLILVPYLETLTQVAGVRLFPVSTGRYLVVIPARGRTHDLELSLRDMLEAGTVPAHEKSALEDLVRLLARYRRQLSIAEESFLIILQERPG